MTKTGEAMGYKFEVGAVIRTVTAYDKDIDFINDGVKYRVILHWDDHDGFSITWLDSENRFITTPDWLEDEDAQFYGQLAAATQGTIVHGDGR
jgi:hypothetical protein